MSQRCAIEVALPGRPPLVSVTHAVSESVLVISRMQLRLWASSWRSGFSCYAALPS